MGSLTWTKLKERSLALLFRVYRALSRLARRPFQLAASDGNTNVPLVYQETMTDCGPACLAMMLAHHGLETPLDEVRAASRLRKGGIDVHSLLDAARHLGLEGQGVKVDSVDDLQALATPFILHLTPKHYAVFEGWTRNRASLADPFAGRRLLSRRQLASRFSGKVLCLYRPAPEPSQPKPTEIHA